MIGYRVLVPILATVLLGVGCTAEEPISTGQASTDSPTETIDESDQANSASEPEEPSESSEADTGSADSYLADLPKSADPCAQTPIELIDQFPDKSVEYGFEFRDVRRPVGVVVPAATELQSDDVLVWVMLHGAGLGWASSEFGVRWSLKDPDLGGRPSVLVLPQAELTDSSFWTADETFNVDYMSTLWSEVDAMLCLERATIVLGGFGQGVIPAMEAYCEGVLQPDLMFFFTGMMKMLDCPAGEPAAIVSTDIYEFDPAMGPHWEGSWDQPNVYEVEVTGGIGPTPEDMAQWATLFGCDDVVDEEELPSPSGTLHRPTVVRAYRSCVVPIVAFGLQNAVDPGLLTPGQLQPAALSEARDRILQELSDALG